ncbi:hypothetical protein F4779DRAFT_229187 [Xylariaceae sp. FL0662B]|nr:hypothetical protein F4779DRAFT_229187 [Xylariaceae sp. FL0662B]
MQLPSNLHLSDHHSTCTSLRTCTSLHIRRPRKRYSAKGIAMPGRTGVNLSVGDSCQGYCNAWKDRSQFSKTQLREDEPCLRDLYLREMLCQGYCNAWKDRSQLSKTQLKEDEPRCNACVTWGLQEAHGELPSANLGRIGSTEPITVSVS